MCMSRCTRIITSTGHGDPAMIPAKVPHDHAEAVVEGHGDTDAVLLGVADQLADEEAVVEDVVVRERRALGEALGVPLVYWMFMGWSKGSAAIRSRSASSSTVVPASAAHSPVSRST